MISLDRAALGEKRRDVDRLMATATKHYVRQEVWLPVAAERQKELDRPLRYFTLTTPDLFDVKLLERSKLLEKTGRGYPGLGFCERSDKIYSDIVRSLRWCGFAHKGSFEDMVLRNDEFEMNFKFDVINLDFTWVPFPKKESPLEGTWGAIRKVLEVQRAKKTSFDLFMTFRGSRKGTDEDSIHRLSNLLLENLSAGRGVEQFQSRVGHRDPTRLLSEDYLTFISVGLPKLFVGEALSVGFHLSRMGVYSYSRTAGERTYHIIKFVFGLEIPMAMSRTFAEMPGLVVQYDSAVPQIFEMNIVDIDEILRSDGALTASLEKDLDTLRSEVQQPED